MQLLTLCVNLMVYSLVVVCEALCVLLLIFVLFCVIAVRLLVFGLVGPVGLDGFCVFCELCNELRVLVEMLWRLMLRLWILDELIDLFWILEVVMLLDRSCVLLMLLCGSVVVV